MNENEEELYEHYTFTVAKGQTPLRIDKYITDKIENATRNRVQQAIKNTHIHVNDIPQKSNYKVKGGDEIKVLFSYPLQEFVLEPEYIPLDIRYEDEHLMVIHKAAGIVVHPGHGNYTHTLLNGILYHTQQLSTSMPLNSEGRPSLVHRIDKNTSGLLVVAKTHLAMSKLALQFFNKTSTREYIALVWGDVEKDKGTITGHIGRNPKNRLQMFVFEDGLQGKEAVTHYEVLERLTYVTLISCKLETGRTHQIRVHLKHIGHILFNDSRYGGDKILKGTSFTKYKQFVNNCFEILPRQALHAKTLGFIHPKTNKEMIFHTELPEDMQQCLEKWRKYFTNCKYKTLN